MTWRCVVSHNRLPGQRLSADPVVAQTRLVDDILATLTG